MLFTPPQQQVLKAVVNRIIPPDDYPNAWDAGVDEYLARQFERDLKSLVETYQAALVAIDAEAEAHYGSGFASLAPEQQDAVLQLVEVGDVRTTWIVEPVGFFRMLVNHTAEGYYGSPLQGGNHDAVSWRMVGFVG